MKEIFSRNRRKQNRAGQQIAFSANSDGLRHPAAASHSLASRWPRPQRQLPVSAIGGGRCSCRTHGSAPILRIGAPLPGHSLEKLSAVLMASAPFAPARCAKPCLKCRLRLKSTEKPDGKCEDFSRWWSGERRRDGVNGDNTALRQNRYTFYGNYAIL